MGYRINTVDTSDNKTLGNTSAVLVTFEASSAASPLSEIGYPSKALATAAKSLQVTGGTSAVTITELTTSVGGNAASQSAAVTATNSYPTDSRADVRNPDANVSVTTAQVGTLKTHNQTSWL